MTDTTKLVSILKDLQQNIANKDLQNSVISKSTVGWQIEHALLTVSIIISALKNSDPKNYKWRFNAKKILVFTMNKIPRGKAKSPDSVAPKEVFDIDSLHNHFDNVLEELKTLEKLNHKNYFVHPFFGHLNRKNTIRFLEIHTQHHLHIINDIVHSLK